MPSRQATWPAGCQSMAVIFGTQGRDTLDGTGFDDLIRGWAEGGNPATDLGDRLLFGLAGNDTLFGGGGGDTVFGGSGQDELAPTSNRSKLKRGGINPHPLTGQ